MTAHLLTTGLSAASGKQPLSRRAALTDNAAHGIEPKGTMTVRWRILAFIFASLGFIVLIIGVMAVTLRTADQFGRRMDGLHARFEVVAQLDGRANHYAAQVAKTLLLGNDDFNRLQAARLDMVMTLAELGRVTRAEIATLRGMAQVQAQLSEIENARRITEVYHTIDAAVTRAIALNREGRSAEAIALYVRDAEFRLANELQALIGRELQNERSEVVSETNEVRALQQNILMVAVGVTLAAMLSVAALGVLLYRAVVRPLDALGVAARAIAAGQLDHHVGIRGSDEFAGLAQSFNQMAKALGEQRAGMVRAGERLSEEVERRTRQLSEANARLRSIDGRRAQFLADVSHQLRTPLTILRGEADVALRGAPDANEQRHALLQIRGQAAELGQLLEDLIDFARADAESYQHLPKRVTVEDVVVAAVQEGAVLAEPREIGIELRLGDEGSAIDADFRRLKQALLIGLDNAVKHSPPGSRIIVETARIEGNVTIAINDEGPGVSPEDQPNVFERFYRAESENTLLNSGLGIGLAIAKEIVDRHAGEISLDNRAQGGAVLRIVLPSSMEGALP